MYARDPGCKAFRRVTCRGTLSLAIRHAQPKQKAYPFSWELSLLIATKPVDFSFRQFFNFSENLIYPAPKFGLESRKGNVILRFVGIFFVCSFSN